MFDDLQQQIKRYDQESTTPRQRRIQSMIVLVVSIVLFGGLYATIRFVEF